MFNTIPPLTRNIIILNVVVFLLVQLLQNDQLTMNLAAFYPFSPYFHSWQVITHMFMHGSFFHILFNMMTLFSFGPVLEQVLGDKKYLLLYFLSGLGAFFLFNLWNFIEIEQIKSSLTAHLALIWTGFCPAKASLFPATRLQWLNSKCS